MIRRAAELDGVRLDGLQAHAGSQVLEVGAYVAVARALREVAGRCGFDPTVRDVGGGFGVTYGSEQRPRRRGRGDRASRRARRRRGAGGARAARSCANPGLTLYRVLARKRAGDRTLLAVDGGMSDNLRPALYDAQHEVRSAAARGPRDREGDRRRPPLRVRRCPAPACDPAGGAGARRPRRDGRHGGLRLPARPRSTTGSAVRRSSASAMGGATLWLRREEPTTRTGRTSYLAPPWASRLRKERGLSERVVRVGMLGCGTVGSAVARTLDEHVDDIARRAGVRLAITRVAVRDLDRERETCPCRVRRSPPMASRSSTIPRSTSCSSSSAASSPRERSCFARSPRASRSSPGTRSCSPTPGAELEAAAPRERRRPGLRGRGRRRHPADPPAAESLAGDRVTRILGIVNGTTNYILTQMSERGWGFDEALAEAQRLGYAEADPDRRRRGVRRGGEVRDPRVDRVRRARHDRRRLPRGHRARHARRTSPTPRASATS